MEVWIHKFSFLKEHVKHWASALLQKELECVDAQINFYQSSLIARGSWMSQKKSFAHWLKERPSYLELRRNVGG